MALPHLITKSEQEWLFKLTKSYSKWPERDLCLLAFFIGSPCKILELNKITISDVLSSTDKINKSFIIRGDKAFNGDYREMYIKENIAKFLRTYLESIPNLFNNEFLFRTLKGESFAITTIKGNQKPNSLTRHILDLLRESGIENPSSESGRRTFATAAHRKGEHISTIHWLLGNKMLKTTKRLINSDPLTMGEVSINAY
jgi:integrase